MVWRQGRSILGCGKEVDQARDWGGIGGRSTHCILTPLPAGLALASAELSSPIEVTGALLGAGEFNIELNIGGVRSHADIATHLGIAMPKQQ